MIRKNELYSEYMNDDFPSNLWSCIIFHLNQGSTDQNLGPNKTRNSTISKPETEPDQDQEKFQNQEPDRTKTEKNFQISARTRTNKILKVDPWFEYHLLTVEIWIYIFSSLLIEFSKNLGKGFK